MQVILSLDDRPLAVTRAETIFGRAPDCDVVLHDKSVSRVHAAILLGGSGPVIRDLGSRNGTRVNGLRLGSDRLLGAGDEVHLGCARVQVLEIASVRGRDDDWLAVQAELLRAASTAQRYREADEILFRLAEAIEAQLSLDQLPGDDACDAALAAVIDYALLRARPGWTRWVMGVHAKLGAGVGPALRRSLESAEEELPASGTMPIARVALGRRTG